MFPDKEAVQREVDAVHALGMNCVQTHRHFPKAAVLDGFDHAGLLRYCEVGGGSTIWDESSGVGNRKYDGPVIPSGKRGEPVTFANRYELAKLLAMIKAYRSHPSVILWSLNNETGADSHNAKIFYAMEKVHELDPSRIVILKSGFSPEGEIMGRPYSSELAYGESASNHDSGWHDIHNEDDTGVYQDSLYKGPTDFKCYTTDNKGIAMWGELGTADSPDNDAATVKWYQDYNVPGYNRVAAEARLNAYETFLDKYQFRAAFPTAEALFTQVGARHYFDAAHIVENARMADANDYIALTGWESTTIDNNSGLVDALRHLKGDPSLVKQANAPALLVLHARHYVVAKGDKAVVDAFIINQVDHHGAFTLHFAVAMDSAQDRPFFETSFPVKVTGGEVFGELLKDNISFTPPAAGPVTMTISLTASGDAQPILQRTEPLLVVDPNPAPLSGTIACADYEGKLIPALKKHFGIAAVPLDGAPDKVDTIFLDSAGAPRSVLNVTDVQRTSHTENTDDPGLYSEEAISKKGELVEYKDLAPGDASVELFFAESYFDHAGQRLFDMALNGRTVLKNFDIYTAAGGRAKAVVRKFSVACPDGRLTVSIPNIAADQPEIAAIRITDAKGNIIREVFRAKAYQSSTGETWNAVRSIGFDWNKVLSGALDRVRKGARLVILGKDTSDVGQAARILAKDNILTYNGTAGFDDTPWIGHWSFGRKHWLLDGLTSVCVLA